MALLKNPFDASTIEPMQSFDIMEPGKYPMVFTDSEMKATAAGTGEYLQLTAEIIDGQHKGRKLWVRLNLENPNRTAVEIAERELASICQAVGVMTPSDSAELHNIPFVGTVKIEPAKGQYDARNSIGGYASMSGAAPTPTPARAAPAPAQAAAGQFPGWAAK